MEKEQSAVVEHQSEARDQIWNVADYLGQRFWKNLRSHTYLINIILEMELLLHVKAK